MKKMLTLLILITLLCYSHSQTPCKNGTNGCEKCATYNNITCQKCMTNYTYYNTSCIICEVENCILCQSSNRCTTCKSGYLPTNSKCYQCSNSRCQMCNPDNYCIKCTKWYPYTLTDGNCYTCTEKVQYCTSCLSDTQCKQCQANFILINNKCVCNTIPNCQICPQVASKQPYCTKCILPYIANNGKCILCPDQCLNCTTTNYCSRCKTNYTLFEGNCYICNANNMTYCSICNKNNYCKICKSGYTEYQGICFKCDTNIINYCQQCSFTNYCVKCSDGLIAKDGVCVKSQINLKNQNNRINKQNKQPQILIEEGIKQEELYIQVQETI